MLSINPEIAVLAAQIALLFWGALVSGVTNLLSRKLPVNHAFQLATFGTIVVGLLGSKALLGLETTRWVVLLLTLFFIIPYSITLVGSWSFTDATPTASQLTSFTSWYASTLISSTLLFISGGLGYESLPAIATGGFVLSLLLGGIGGALCSWLIQNDISSFARTE